MATLQQTHLIDTDGLMFHGMDMDIQVMANAESTWMASIENLKQRMLTGCEHLLASLPINKNDGEPVTEDPPPNVTTLIWPPSRTTTEWLRTKNSAVGATLQKRLMDMSHFTPTITVNMTGFCADSARAWLTSLDDADHQAWAVIHSEKTTDHINEDYDKHSNADLLSARTMRCNWLKKTLRSYGQTETDPRDLTWTRTFRPRAMHQAADKGHDWINHPNHGGKT